MSDQRPRCTAGNDPARCCVGDPWSDISPHGQEPLDPAVIAVAATSGIDPHTLDYHVTGVHGWESHDIGYAAAVAAAAGCIGAGGCLNPPFDQPPATVWCGLATGQVVHPAHGLCPGIS